jgi:hypothetical protein
MVKRAKKRSAGRWRRWLVAVVLVVSAGAAFVFLRVETASGVVGVVEGGDLVVFESATIGAPRSGQIVAVDRHGMTVVVAVEGDEVTWAGKLRVNGHAVDLGAPLKRPETGGRDAASLLFRGSSGAVGGASSKIPSSVDIPRSPFTITRHHLLVARPRGAVVTTHLVPLADVRGTGRIVIASTIEGEPPRPRLLP